MNNKLIRSSRSAFSSPEQLRANNSNAPNFGPEVSAKLEKVKELETIAERCRQVVEGIKHLKNDRISLEQKLNESSYTDERLQKNYQKIKRLLETTILTINVEAEVSSGGLWKEVETYLNSALQRYNKHLQSCEGRNNLIETRKCLTLLEKLLAKSEEEFKLTCCVCLDGQVGFSVACGHTLCNVCVQSVQSCPVCRKHISPEDIRPIYFV